jgi:hypothetical protein
MLVILTLGRLKEENHYLEASLGYSSKTHPPPKKIEAEFHYAFTIYLSSSDWPGIHYTAQATYNS